MLKILVVDDSSFMRINLKKILEEAGHIIIGEACNGVEAVKKYSDLKPDVVTMDITMPEKNGLDALSEIRDNDQNANIIMVTAIGQKDKVLEALNRGARDYIVKPFDKNKVLDAMYAIS